MTAGGGMDPREAAVLLERTRLRARRQLEPAPPWLLVVRAVLVLVACGTVWLSVRGQHPYRHPTAADVVVMVAFGIVNLGVTVAVAKRATTGIRGRSRLRPAEIGVLTVVWVGVYVVMVAMAVAGVRDSVVYGWYPIAVPLIAAGLAWAAIMGARARWREVGTALAVGVVGVVGVLAGPAGAWAVAGVGLCLTLLGTAAAIAWQQRR
jgi:hypothetical protein